MKQQAQQGWHVEDRKKQSKTHPGRRGGESKGVGGKGGDQREQGERGGRGEERQGREERCTIFRLLFLEEGDG